MATQEITGITIEKGTDFSVSFLIDSFDGQPLPINGYVATAKIRKYPASAKFNSFVAEVLGGTGRVTISMNKETTKLLSTGRNYFDILLTNQFETIKPVKGTIMVEDTSSV
jgi:hypothetical protein